MNAGKSTQLLQAAFNYKEGGHRVCLYTAEIDSRSGSGVIASRIGLKSEACVFNSKTDFSDELMSLDDETECVIIDEAQFLSGKQVRDIHAFVHDQDVAVIAYGLRTDFQGVPFEGATWLLALADDIQEIRSVCGCGRKAAMNIRLDAQGEREFLGSQISIGGNSRYRAVCPKCFYSPF
jgi:thymidine kinase